MKFRALSSVLAAWSMPPITSPTNMRTSSTIRWPFRKVFSFWRTPSHQPIGKPHFLPGWAERCAH